MTTSRFRRAHGSWRCGLPAIALVVLVQTPFAKQAVAEAPAVPVVEFQVKPEVVLQHLSSEFCWFHPRAAAIPGLGRDGMPAVIMTLQRHLARSDHYSGLYVMRTDDLGKTWSGPEARPECARVPGFKDYEVIVADPACSWHAKTQKLIVIGCTVVYDASGGARYDVPRPSQTAYAVHDPKTGTWSEWKILEMPKDEKFNFARCSCAQWVVKPDGELLLPIYFSPKWGVPFSSTVLRCSFDGQTITYLEHGTELTLYMDQGVYEPSLIRLQNRYYLTLRSNERGYVATSDDGLHFEPMSPWKFDDGSDLGSYNTQQHWLAHRDGLFLSYTRRGANNDHIPYCHRAPIFIAQVDPKRLVVMRKTEKIAIPERGVMLGNFGACPITEHESWITDAEFLVGDKPDPRGGNGSTWVSRILWSKPNK